jgi:hypothetical protein
MLAYKPEFFPTEDDCLVVVASTIINQAMKRSGVECGNVNREYLPQLRKWLDSRRKAAPLFHRELMEDAAAIMQALEAVGVKIDG